LCGLEFFFSELSTVRSWWARSWSTNVCGSYCALPWYFVDT